MADNDTQLELKKRARRRLVGAVALAVLAAIVLPMVMDQEPKPLNQDIQIRIPSQDSGAFTSRVMPVKPAAPASDAKPAAEAKPADETRPAPSAPTPELAKGDATKSDNHKPATDSAGPGGSERAADKPAEGSAAQPSPKAADKIAETRAKAETARAVAILSGDNAREQWVVQLGAFQNAGNARHLQAKLKSEGYNSYTEPLKTPGGTKTRVRAGPFPSREAAEKARDKLKRIGLNGVVAQK